MSSLSNLPEYAAVAASISTMKEKKPTWNYVSMTLMQEQERQGSQNKRVKSMDTDLETLTTSIESIATKNNNSLNRKGTARCYNCGKLGHGDRNCKKINKK